MSTCGKMKQVEPERVGRALRQMAEDLVTERRRVVLLQRENRQLKTELEELRRVVAAQDVDTSVGDLGRHPGVPD
jgi:hypothetical protein